MRCWLYSNLLLDTAEVFVLWEYKSAWPTHFRFIQPPNIITIAATPDRFSMFSNNSGEHDLKKLICDWFPWYRTCRNSEGGPQTVVSDERLLALGIARQAPASGEPRAAPSPSCGSAHTHCTGAVSAAFITNVVSTPSHPKSWGPRGGKRPESHSFTSLQEYKLPAQNRRTENILLLAPEPLGTKQSIHKLNKIKPESTPPLIIQIWWKRWLTSRWELHEQLPYA